MVDGAGGRVVVVIQKVLLCDVEYREEIVKCHKPKIGVGVGDLGKKLGDRLRGRIVRDGGRHDGCRGESTGMLDFGGFRVGIRDERGAGDYLLIDNVNSNTAPECRWAMNIRAGTSSCEAS